MRHPIDGVERAVGILEHHRHPAAVIEDVAARSQRAQRPTFEADFPTSRPIDERQQPSHRALSAATFADQRDDLPLRDRQVDVVGRMEKARGEESTDAKVLRQP